MAQFLRTKQPSPPSEVGKISFFGHANADAELYIACDGLAVSRSTYSVLFAEIGTTHGIGDGSTTFNLPDCRGRVPRGTDGGAGVDPDAGSRTGVNGGNSGDGVGSVQGDNFKSHRHPFKRALGSSLDTPTNAGHYYDSNGGTGNYLNSDTNTGGSETRMKNIGMAFYIRYK